jgi:predicted glycoside hydrolase/deacetylase ChbG (UPF0249 family)
MNRRELLQYVAVAGAGAAVAATRGVAQGRPGTRKSSRKMVIRADDIGHSKVCNIGTFEAIDYGMIGAADVMLDSPGTEDALARLRAYPWLSIGWHTHMWGAPVLGAAAVPSLVEKGGQFDGRFRMDLARAEDISADEAVRELRAQLARCQRILGKLPDTGSGGNTTTIWGRAMRQVADEAKIAHDFSENQPNSAAYAKHVEDAQHAGEAWAQNYMVSKGSPADPKWADRKITTIGTAAFIDLLTDSIGSVEKNYDPVNFYLQDRSGILKQPADVISWQAWHPGYVDYYVYRLGERVNRARAQQFVVGRTQDVAAMTDPRLRNWIKANGIELINFRDALYGTRDFQRHLAAAGSDLAVV